MGAACCAPQQPKDVEFNDLDASFHGDEDKEKSGSFMKPMASMDEAKPDSSPEAAPSDDEAVRT